ncbi:MAG TPA: lipoyl synthase [Terriglobia bacterium]|nr:lipoyl synthase [Terriglobia bacterium]
MGDLVQLNVSAAVQRRPEWLKVRIPGGDNYFDLKRLMRGLSLHTVCESARCPNVGECWGHRTATFMILGELCTRRCGFCAVPKGRPAGQVDWDEPERVAEAAANMGLKYIVVTSVDRDDLADGGSTIFARTIEALRGRIPGCKVEVLIPDFRGSDEALEVVLAARPDVLNHNIETVPRLYPVARRGSLYERSLRLLRHSREIDASIPTKSGLMVGLGETMEELIEVLRDLAAAGVDIVTIGQYLRPSGDQLPVARFYTPEEFATLKREGMRFGIRHVESGPLVRSSYHAHEQADALSDEKNRDSLLHS